MTLYDAHNLRVILTGVWFEFWAELLALDFELYSFRQSVYMSS